MTHFQAARFEVVIANESSPMYDEPDASNHDEPFTQQKYIEAVADATFSIKVTLDPDFDFANCDAVRAKVNLDGDLRGWYQDLKPRDVFGGGRQACLDTITRWCPEAGQWQKASYSFGKLDIKEASDSRVSREQISSLGSIRISFRRIYFGAPTEGQYQTPQRISEVSEKMLKGKSIQHSIAPTAFVKGLPPPPTVAAIPLPGDLGREVVVNVLYRSKSTLQMLGCIPRSPSPQPILRPQNGRATTVADTNVKEELRTLRVSSEDLFREAAHSDDVQSPRLGLPNSRIERVLPLGPMLNRNNVVQLRGSNVNEKMERTPSNESEIKLQVLLRQST
ncbi:MAG: hypothetical protein Q9182_003520 [Xanthomendoza sp. 2 TL-2023]